MGLKIYRLREPGFLLKVIHRIRYTLRKADVFDVQHHRYMLRQVAVLRN